MTEEAQPKNRGGNGSSEALDQGLTLVSSYVDRKTHTVLARGQFGPLLNAYVAHAAGLGALPAGAALEVMRDMLSAATLQLALWPPDQYCSWTLNLVAPPLNVFIAGDNGGFNITGRVYTENVKTLDQNRLFVETQRPKHKPARSVVDFTLLNVDEAFQQYYDRSLQMRAKLLTLGEDRLLIQGLPTVDRDWFALLDEAAVEELFARGLERIEERTYRFFCGCDAQRIHALVREIFAKNPADLFGSEDQVEVQCPRCGRHFLITRADLEVGQA